MTYKAPRGVLLIPLVAPVLLSGCVWQSDYDAVVAKNQQLERQVTADAQEKRQLQQQLASSQQQVITERRQNDRLVGAMRYTVNSDLLFPSGSWQMSPEGQRIIAKYASQLAPTQQNKVVVNGYTDDAPIGPDLRRRGVASNMELSQKRAESVVEFMIQQGVKPDMVQARGLGEADPIASNQTAQGRAQNRRVEIALVPSS